MLIFGMRKFIQASFDSEDELERVVEENAEYIFGPASLYLPKALIRTKDGFGTVPDAFVIDLSEHKWFVVEVELSKHSVWNHIAPQVAKQIIAAAQPATRQLLVDSAVELARDDDSVMDKFSDEGIEAIDIRKVLEEIFEKMPIIGMPIDSVSTDLREWATTLKVSVKLWIVRKLVEFSHPENVIYEIPEEYKPVLDTEEQESTSSSGMARYDVTLIDLLGEGLLEPGERLCMSYKPRGGERKNYEATIGPDGSLEVQGTKFNSPSYAAIYGMQQEATSRSTVNGWTAWKNSDGLRLADLREEYLQKERQRQTDPNYGAPPGTGPPDRPTDL